MKILLVDFFSDGEPTELTEEAFYERYGATVFNLDQCKDDPEWETLYVSDDPFAAEILFKTQPLVDNNYDDLHQQVLDTMEEI